MFFFLYQSKLASLSLWKRMFLWKVISLQHNWSLAGVQNYFVYMTTIMVFYCNMQPWLKYHGLFQYVHAHSCTPTRLDSTLLQFSYISKCKSIILAQYFWKARPFQVYSFLSTFPFSLFLFFFLLFISFSFLLFHLQTTIIQWKTIKVFIFINFSVNMLSYPIF